MIDSEAVADDSRDGTGALPAARVAAIPKELSTGQSQMHVHGCCHDCICSIMRAWRFDCAWSLLLMCLGRQGGGKVGCCAVDSFRKLVTHVA